MPIQSILVFVLFALLEEPQESLGDRRRKVLELVVHGLQDLVVEKEHVLDERTQALLLREVVN